MPTRRTALELAAGIALGGPESALAADQETTTTERQWTDIYLAGATGGQEIPPVRTEAQAAAVFASNGEGGVDYALAARNAESVTMAHLHVGPVGENGPVVAWLYPETGRSPEPIPGAVDGTLAAGTVEASDLTGPLEGTTVERLLAGMRGEGIHVDVHTERNPDGEVRGQVVSVTELFDVLTPG